MREDHSRRAHRPDGFHIEGRSVRGDDGLGFAPLLARLVLAGRNGQQNDEPTQERPGEEADAPVEKPAVTAEMMDRAVTVDEVVALAPVPKQIDRSRQDHPRQQRQQDARKGDDRHGEGNSDATVAPAS